jgi:hypothetical protein
VELAADLLRDLLGAASLVIRLWPALIIAPLVALTSISAGYALVTPACDYARPWMLHASTLFFLVLTLAMTALAWTALATARREFLPLVSTWSGAFFTVVIVVQWTALAILTPCMHSP